MESGPFRGGRVAEKAAQFGGEGVGLAVEGGLGCAACLALLNRDCACRVGRSVGGIKTACLLRFPSQLPAVSGDTP